ncbi:hypothetical protein MTR67_007462 [Solanum verrucosum]|uniref:Reverse transcriptase/retrotransposon-derived protein RNase H-like domain-containing protein n=1 Tax=Solanum verrucosum TaxID=315347 RepID=A0AAF0TAM5_SOLVR|nr:hypothetical protein MTR67_007462 [Solanum verrucosum]
MEANTTPPTPASEPTSMPRSSAPATLLTQAMIYKMGHLTHSADVEASRVEAVVLSIKKRVIVVALAPIQEELRGKIEMITTHILTLDAFTMRLGGRDCEAEAKWCEHERIEAVKGFPRPTTSTNIKIVLGLASNYRRFVEGLSSIAALLARLTQKKAKFQWYDVGQKRFKELKAQLTSALVFILPEGT